MGESKTVTKSVNTVTLYALETEEEMSVRKFFLKQIRKILLGWLVDLQAPGLSLVKLQSSAVYKDIAEKKRVLSFALRHDLFQIWDTGRFPVPFVGKR